MKRLTAVLVVVLAVSAAILMYSSTQESRGEAIIHAAEARLAELSEMEVVKILVNSSGKEYILDDPEDIRAVQDVLLKIEPKLTTQNELKKYHEVAAGARSMALHFFRSDGTKELLTLDDFDAETPYGTMVFTTNFPGAPRALSLVRDAFYPKDEQLSYGYAYLERLCGGNIVSLQASYNGESRSLEDGDGIARVLATLLDAELEADGWYGPSSEALTLEFFYEDGGYARMRVPCFKTEGKFGMERYELYADGARADKVLWNLFST